MQKDQLTLMKRIEEASLNAWPCIEQILFDGWILRFSKGYTKRANSVNLLSVSDLPIQDKVLICERFYAEKKLPCIFRLTSFAEASALDTVLEQRGYAKIDPTLVMHLELSQPIGDEQLELIELSLDEWIGMHARLRGVTLDKAQIHQQILQKIPCNRIFACLKDAEKTVAVGLGVLEEGYFGLFDLRTDSAHRRKGFGTRIVRHMLMWAQKRGARYAYLQVTVANVPARHFYSSFGFQELYHYWYRVPSLDSAKVWQSALS